MPTVVLSAPVKPLVAAAKATTAADLRAVSLRYAKRVLTGNYERLSAKDPRWDQPARRLLAYAEDRRGNQVTAADAEARAKRAEDDMAALAKAGCDDALVLCVMGQQRVGQKRWREACDLLQAALRAQAVRPYPADREYAMGETLLEANEHTGVLRGPKVQPLTARLCGVYARALAEPMQPGEQRLLLKSAERFWKVDLQSKADSLLDAIAQTKGADPWVPAMIRGKWERARAWDSRGTDWAANVSREGWKGLREHLAAATKALTAAYELHPEFPEAATEMIGVTMGGGGVAGVTEREWFNRAIAAQFDYDPAYDDLAWALMPRWGGSHKEMIALAEECLASNRYDTVVPFLYPRILSLILRDDEVDPFFDQHVFDNYEKVVAGYAAKNGDDPHSLTGLMATAARTGRWARADEIRRKLGDRVDKGALMPLDADQLLRDIQSHAGHS